MIPGISRPVELERIDALPVDGVTLEYRERRSGTLLPKLALPALLALFFALSTTINVLTPLWENIDEPGNFQYVKFVAEQHRLPGPRDQLPDLSAADKNCANVRCIGAGAATDQPPLYYVAVAPFVAGIDMNRWQSWVGNPYFTWANHPLRNGVAIQTRTDAWPYHGMVLGAHVMRAVSGLMGVATLCLIYFAGVALTKRRAFGLVAAALAGLTPGFLLSSASINDDNAAALMGSLGLLCAVKALTTPRGKSWRWLVLLGGSVALGLLAKSSLAFLIPVALVVGATLVLREATSRRARLGLALLTAAGAAVMVAGFASRPDRVHRLKVVTLDVLGVAIHHPACGHRCPNPLQGIWGGVPNMWETYWGSFGWETFHLASSFYKPFLLFSVLALIGAVLLMVRSKRRLSIHLGAFALVAGSFLILLAMVVYRDMTSHYDGGTTHGRFLFPALLASSVFLAAGLWSLPRRVNIAALSGLLLTCLAAIGYSIYVVPRSFGPAAPVYGDLVSAGAQQPMDMLFSRGMQLRGINKHTTTVRAGDNLTFELFWDAFRSINFDYSEFARLDNGQGTIVHGSDHGLGQEVGLLSHAWERGEIIPDRWTIAVPASTPPGDYTVEIGVYDYRDLQPIPNEALNAVVKLWTVHVTGPNGA